VCAASEIGLGRNQGESVSAALIGVQRLIVVPALAQRVAAPKLSARERGIERQRFGIVGKRVIKAFQSAQDIARARATLPRGRA